MSGNNLLFISNRFSMLQKITDLLNEVATFSVKNQEELESFRLKYLSKKGIIADLFEDFRNVPISEKKEFGQKLNILKHTIHAA